MHNNIMAAGSRDRPWTPTTVVVPAVPAIYDSPVVPEHKIVETPMNMSPENIAHYESEKEAIHLILTGIGDEIYSTVDACKTAQEMWEAIERLQQEWLRFVTIVKKQHKLDEVSYHKLFDILKQYQKEVNELRAKQITRNANPLALVATTQSNQDPYYQTPKPHKPYAPASEASIPTRSHVTTRNKGKEIAKPITPPSESASKEDSDREQAQRDKDMQKKLALIAKYFKKIYKPANNNLKTSLNSRNKNVDTTPRYKNDNQSGQFGSQRTVNVTRARENELEAHYSYMAKIQEVPTADSGTDFEPLEQVNECECLALKLSKQTESVNKEVYTELLRSFAKLEKHSISLELTLQQCQEQLKNDTVCKEKASNVFQKECEQYFEIQDLKAQLQDKNIAISELKKLLEKCKGKYVETKLDKPSVVR
nr:hypothetical protein [Tanacetum cinerariifolium]